MGEYYILDENKNAIPTDRDTWSAMFQNSDRKVARDQVAIDDGLTVRVSTVFLGLDHGMPGNTDRPVIFETMIFDHVGSELYARRYSTYAEAEEGHVQAVNWATPALHPVFQKMAVNIVHPTNDDMYWLVHKKHRAFMSFRATWTTAHWDARTYTRDEAIAMMEGSAMMDDDGRWMSIGKRFYLEE